MNSYRLFTPQESAREGVALFGPKSARTRHLGSPYSIVATLFDIPLPPHLLTPPSRSSQHKLLHGTESQILKAVNTTNFVDKSTKRAPPSAPYPGNENIEVDKKRLKIQNHYKKPPKKDCLVF